MFLCFSILRIDMLNTMHIIIGVVIRRPMNNILSKSIYLQIQKPTAFWCDVLFAPWMVFESDLSYIHPSSNFEVPKISYPKTLLKKDVLVAEYWGLFRLHERAQYWKTIFVLQSRNHSHSYSINDEYCCEKLMEIVYRT